MNLRDAVNCLRGMREMLVERANGPDTVYDQAVAWLREAAAITAMLDAIRKYECPHGASMSEACEGCEAERGQP